jgi:hypothetical protein
MENDAGYRILSFVSDGIIEVRITGEITQKTFENLLIDADEILKASGVGKALWDVRALEGRFAYENVYARARSYTRRYYDIHNAIVDIPVNADFVSLNEARIVNAGVSLKCFTDIDIARSWLKRK